MYNMQQQEAKAIKEQLWALFNRKWTKDVDTKGYDKEEWKKLEELILYFMKDKP